MPLTNEQKSKIATEFKINVGPDATARENGQVTKYLVAKALEKMPNK